MAVLSLFGVSTPRHTATAAPAPTPTIGVVDFYAVSPVPWWGGVIADQFAADDFSGMLARAGMGRIVVVPRREVQAAERTLGWHNADVLRYARLSDLAHLLRADRLAVGWIRALNVDTGGGDDGTIPRMGGGHDKSASAVLQLQVFDAAQGRIVAQVRSEGSARGLVVGRNVQAALHQALEPAVAPTLSGLAGAAP